MQRFAELYGVLDQTTSLNAKVAALARYLAAVNDDDRLWSMALILGRTPRRTVTSTELRRWAADAAGLPLWLFEESYAIVGDLAETIALVLPPNETVDRGSLARWMGDIAGLAGRDETARRQFVFDAWARLDTRQRFIFNKLVTGGLRVGVSQKLLTRAIASASGLDEATVAERLMGDWSPAATTFHDLLHATDATGASSRPYPFHLAYPLETPPEALGAPAEWLAEYKWDGIRAQLVARGARAMLWSRGEEVIGDRFPEIMALAAHLPPGTVIDGEIAAWRDGGPLPFQLLQKRIGRRNVGKKLLAEAPVALVAYDVIEWGGIDIRSQPLDDRRALLGEIASRLPPDAPFTISRPVSFATWDELAAARIGAPERGCEGLMLKHRTSPYRAGRRKGEWWKWKVDPLSVDAVMIYAQAGHGRRANLYTDFTFAVWHGDGELVPFTKAYSGLTDAEFAEITQWVRRNTLERFGPVRRVAPELVFEIAFEGIQASSRHKSGIALRFPRMARWRRDKAAADADTLDDLKSLLASRSG
ncbi:MAG: ATP-dependent DNA ligase [Hyphomicrobiaceae bacterium]